MCLTAAALHLKPRGRGGSVLDRNKRVSALANEQWGQHSQLFPTGVLKSYCEQGLGDVEVESLRQKFHGLIFA